MIKYLVWSLMVLALVAFWISLRTKENELEYTLVALGIWAVAFLVNRQFKEKND